MLSGNISIEDDDWDSVRQSHAALTRDLERIFLSIGQGGNDFGGGSPKSANDQTVQQDGNYGYNAVTTDMLDELEAQFQTELSRIPAGGLPTRTTMVTTAGSGTFTPPSGITQYLCIAVAGGAGHCTSIAADYYAAPTSGGSATQTVIVTGHRVGGGGSASIALITGGVSVNYSIGAGGNPGASFGAAGGQTTITGTDVSITAYGGGVSQPGSGGFGGAPPVYSGANIAWHYGFPGQCGFNQGWAGICINGWNVGRGSNSANGGYGWDGGVLFIY